MSLRVKRNGVYESAYAVWAKRAGEYIAALDVFVKRAGVYIRVEPDDPTVPVPLNGARFANVVQVADGWAGTSSAGGSAGRIMTTAYLPNGAEGWIEAEFPVGAVSFTLAFDRDPDETLVNNSNDLFVSVSASGLISRGTNAAAVSTGQVLTPGDGVKIRLRRNSTMQMVIETTSDGGANWALVTSVGAVNPHQLYVRLYTTYASGVAYRIVHPKGFGLLTGVAPAVNLSTNGIQGQWVKRNAVDSRDGTYKIIGSASNTGIFRASKRINATGVVTERTLATNEVDDHNLPAFVQLADGRWMALWNRHSIAGTTGFRYSKSATPDGIDFPTTSINVPGVYMPPSGGNAPSYLQAWLVGTRLWVVHRVGNSAQGRWIIRYSDDPEAETPTWSAEIQLTTVAYLETHLVGTTLCCAMYNHPVTGANHHIHTFDIDLLTGDVDAGLGSIGNVLTGSNMPATQANTRRAVEINTGLSRMFGYDGEAILGMEMASSSSVGTYYRYVRVPGSGLFERQLICTSGFGFLAGDQGYFGGICYDGPNAILAAVNVGTAVGVGAWELQRWATTDGGDTWQKTQTITSSTGIIARPQVLGLLLMWSVMSVYTTFTSFTSRLVIGVRS